MDATTPEAPMVSQRPAGLGRSVRPARQLARWAAAGILALLVTGAAILWSRRRAGALSAPLEPAALLLVSAFLATLVAAARAAWRYAPGGPGAGLPSRLAEGTLSLAAAAIAAALSYPGMPVGGLAILWALLAVEECWAWGLAGSRRFPAAMRARSAAPPGDRATAADFPGSRESVSPTGLDLPPGAEVIQQITRTQTPDGGEVLSGWLRVWMAAGQRSANVHVAFCPSFAQTPRVSVAQRAGPPARVRTIQVLPQGVRFDLKLSAPGEAAEDVLLEFSAEAAPPAAGPEPAGAEPECVPEA